MSMHNEVNLNYMKDILEVSDRRAKVTGKDIFGDLEGLEEPLKWIGKEFVDCTFNNINFTNTVMKNCTFINCTFRSCDTEYAKATGCNFIGCEFKDTCWFINILPVYNKYDNTTDRLGLNSDWDTKEMINFLLEMMSGGYRREVNSKALNILVSLWQEDGGSEVIRLSNVDFFATDIFLYDAINLEFNHCDFRKLNLCARNMDNITFNNCCTCDLSIIVENASNITVQDAVGPFTIEADNLTNFTHDEGVVSKAEKVKFTIDCQMVEEFNVRQVV